MTTTPTERFLSFVARRDKPTLDALLREQVPVAHAYAMRRLGNASDADDAVQEALVRLVTTADRFDGEVPFEAWLTQLVQAAASDLKRGSYRRRQRELAASADAIGSSTATATASPPTSDDIDVVRRALDDLPAAYRDALDLHLFAGLSPQQTAQALDLTTAAAVSRIQRGKAELRARLTRLGVAASLALLVDGLAPAPACAADTLERLVAVGIDHVNAKPSAASVACSSQVWRYAAAVVVSVAAAMTALAWSVPALADAPTGSPSPVAVAWPRGDAPATRTAPMRPFRSGTTADHHHARHWDLSSGAPIDLRLVSGTWSFSPDGGKDGRGCMRNDGVALVLGVDDRAFTPPLRIRCSTSAVRSSPVPEYSALGVWSDYAWVAFVEHAGTPLAITDDAPAWIEHANYLTENAVDSWFAGRSALYVGERTPGASVAIYVYGAQLLQSIDIEEVDVEVVPDASAYIDAVLALDPSEREGDRVLAHAPSDASGQTPRARFWVPDRRQPR